MNVTIHYFAMLRERSGVDSEIVETSAVDARGLWEETNHRRKFGLDRAQFSVAVNDTFVEWNHALVDGDQLVFLPPVSGG